MARPFDHLSPRVTRLGPGPVQGRPEALFLHGAWAGAWCWEPLAQTVAQAGYGVNLLELPGHGQDAWPLPLTTSLNDYALLAARAAGDLGRPVLVGHSMGGWLSQKILEVADLPAALLAPLPGSGLPREGLCRLVAANPWPLLSAFSGRALTDSDVKTARKLFFCDLPGTEIQAILRRMTPEPARAVLEMGLGLARARPKPGRAPRLVLAGGRDPLMPVGSIKRLARRLGARFVLLKDLPHSLWMDDPKNQVARVLLDFLAELK